MSALVSKKFIALMSTMVVLLVGGALGLDASVLERLTELTMTYLAGQSVVDAVSRRRPVEEPT